MSEYNDKMELTVRFCADKNFLISDTYNKYLLQKYIAKGIQGAFKLIGSDCNNFTEVYLRTAEQTLVFDNVIPVVRGKWIYHDDDDMRYDTYHCSVCRKLFTVDAKRADDIGFVIDDLNFCPNCGAKCDL